jgi:peptidoglycan/LPS O-acetylase OafA/YrhL
MLIQVLDPVFQTIIFSIFLAVIFLITLKKTTHVVVLPTEKTQELKGFAILAIIFGHIGYYLSTDPKFLFPLSVLAGVGVNLFLLLSGFGLTLTQLKSPLSVIQFYSRRLSKLFIPVWIVITVLLILDYLILQRSYPLQEIYHSFLGFYPRADLYLNINSPLWYFTFILGYYLIFPWLFFKKAPVLSCLLILGIGHYLMKYVLPIDPDVQKLYNLHYLAFPLGMFLALFIKKLKCDVNRLVKISLFSVSLGYILYTSIHSGVGSTPMREQILSIITALSVIILFTTSFFDSKLFYFFGMYSYEIYLIHWPIFYRFNLFRSLPPALMVIINLVLVLMLAYLLQKVVKKFTRLPQVLLIIVTLLSVTVFSPNIAKAHVLESNNTVGAVLHIDPDDDPIIGSPANFYFEFKDKQDKFSITNCDCIFTITEEGKEIYSQQLMSSGLSENSTIANAAFTFMQRNVYLIKVLGKPRSPESFSPFVLSYDIRVARDPETRSSSETSQTPILSNWKMILAGVIILTVITTGITLRLRKSKN